MIVRMKTINKILYIIICIIIIAGIIVWKYNGFNLELQYSNRDQINISNNTGINIEDVKQIASEVLVGQRYFVQKVEIFGNSVSIVAEDISEEQKTQIIEKFNEKYGTDLMVEDIDTVTIPFTRIKDVIKPFIIPGIIATAIILVYFAIRFNKLGIIKTILKTVINIILFELLLYSIIAICRIPFGSVTIACGIGLYAVIVFILTSKFEKAREIKLAEKQEE